MFSDVLNDILSNPLVSNTCYSMLSCMSIWLMYVFTYILIPLLIKKPNIILKPYSLVKIPNEYNIFKTI